MTLRPEQEQVLRYAREKGTEAPAAELRRRTAATFARLEALLAGIPPEQTRLRPFPGKWCVHEVVDHLIATNRPAVEEVRGLIRGQRPAGNPIPAGLQSSDPMGRPWPDLVQELQQVHADFLAAFDGAPGEDPGVARAPVVMVVKAAEPDGSTVPIEWIEELDWKAYTAVFRAHTIEHQRQIERTLAAAGAATIQPPNA
jgi:hypothetical protein